MEITKDALVRIIKAAHKAKCMSVHIQGLMDSKAGWTEADETSSLLVDALVCMTYEMRVDGKFVSDDERANFIRSNIDSAYKHMSADVAPGTIADEFMKACPNVRQPAPNTIERESFEEMWKKAGGYLYKAVSGDDSR